MILEKDISNIVSKNLHTHYYKLPNESRSNKKETMKSNTLNIVSNPAKFSYWSF